MYYKFKELPKCPKCLQPVEESNEGFYCLKCEILFNICTDCDENPLLHLKAWGHSHTDEYSENFDENYENFKYTHNTTPPKYYATTDDDEALTDISMYLWVCPSCKEEFTTIAD
jgi:hypothetical protein